MGPKKKKTIVRFVKYIKSQGDCIVWTGARDPNGYGYFCVANLIRMAHRYAFEFFNGPIPEGFTIDHLCRNTGCVNPFHLEAVTRGENCLRGIGVCAVNAKKTHCPKGHPYAGENIYKSPSGIGRGCLRCRREYGRQWRKENPELAKERDRIQNAKRKAKKA